MQNILKVKFTTLLLNQNRLWQRDKRDKPLIQPDLTYYNEVCCIDAHSSCHFSSILQLDLPCGVQESPVYSVTTKFVRASANKTRCPIYCISVRMLQCILILAVDVDCNFECCMCFPMQWVPDGRRLITGAASGEFTLWNGINLNFESILQVIIAYPHILHEKGKSLYCTWLQRRGLGG